MTNSIPADAGEVTAPSGGGESQTDPANPVPRRRPRRRRRAAIPPPAAAQPLTGGLEQALDLAGLASPLKILREQQARREVLESFLGSTGAFAVRSRLPQHLPLIGGNLPLGSTAVEEAELRRQIAKKEAVLAQQAAELAKKTEALQKALEEKSATEAQQQELKKRVVALSEGYAELQKQKDLGYLLGRVCHVAAERLLRDDWFVKRFEETKKCAAFVLSIDIRRSTDLMLRGKTPQVYAEFLDTTCGQLVATIKDQFGVIDKFTGDGLLAYFPDFFTGEDAGYRAISAAQACHAIFAQSYRLARSHFTVTLADVGLGIGIDFGEVHLLRVTGELTVVGAPVVYACRLSGAPAGHTYMNHSAVAELERRCKQVVAASEVEFELRHEGLVICQDVTLTPIRYEPALPDWLSGAAEDKPRATPSDAPPEIRS